MKDFLDCKTVVEIWKTKFKYYIKRYNINNDYKLAIVQVGNNLQSNKYVQGKLKDCKEIGINALHYKYDEDFSEENLCCLIKSLNSNNKIKGIIIELPLPKHINTYKIINLIDFNKDIDGLKANYSLNIPVTPYGIIMYLNENNFDFNGKNVVILGRGRVGKPLYEIFLNNHCTVSQVHSKSKVEDIEYLCQNADLIISAVGRANFVNSKMINPNKEQILIDVGINFDENGKMCGDANPEIYKFKNLIYTPVPGGVGLLTRCALIQKFIYLCL